jgi:hypothetical protein
MMDWLAIELLGPIALLAALLGGRVAMHLRRRYRGSERPPDGKSTGLSRPGLTEELNAEAARARLPDTQNSKQTRER